MAGISSLGVGSGVLTSDLVDQLVAAERAPVDSRLAQKTEQTEALLSAYGKLRSAVTELRLPMRQLSAPENFSAFSAVSSSDKIAVSVDSATASRGAYNVEVSGLATAQALASRDVFADRDATSVGQGTLTLSVGDKATTLTIDSRNDTLQGLASAINESDAGVSASVIDTGRGFQLVLSADNTGTANAVSISVSDDADGTNADHQGLSRFAFNDGMATGAGLDETISATDAVITINGVEVTRSTNRFDDVIDGLTFEVSDTGSSTIRIEQDFGAVADRVQGFVDKFNDLQSTIDSLAGFNGEAGVGGLLTGDSTVRGLQNQLRRVLTGVVPGLENAGVRSLADVGITTRFETGGLAFDRATFEKQLQANPDEVTALFAEQGGGAVPSVAGIAERTVDLVSRIVGAGGAIESRTGSLNRDLEQIQQNQARLDARIAAYRERLVRQFSAADALISQLNSTQDFVSQQLAALAPQSTGNG